MFTGIIEELGKVLAIEKQPDAIRLTIGCDKVLSDLGRGDSISCSGTCLTAIEIDDKGFTADVMLETLKRSSLDGVQVGGNAWRGGVGCCAVGGAEWAEARGSAGNSSPR